MTGKGRTRKRVEMRLASHMSRGLSHSRPRDCMLHTLSDAPSSTASSLDRREIRLCPPLFPEIIPPKRGTRLQLILGFLPRNMVRAAASTPVCPFCVEPSHWVRFRAKNS